MQTNPFNKNQMKNYFLAYAGVVVIMILFFIAVSLFYTPKQYPKKEFLQHKKDVKNQEMKRESKKTLHSPIKMLKKGYE